MDVLTKEQRRRNMQAINGKGTKIERSLRRALWTRGLRYRCNNHAVYGKPDLLFTSLKIAVFCDSEFFHGKNWETEKYRIQSNRDFWWKKIESNISRDILVNQVLRNQGYLVIRFWGKEIISNLEDCVERIVQTVELRKYEKLHRDKAIVGV